MTVIRTLRTYYGRNKQLTTRTRMARDEKYTEENGYRMTVKDPSIVIKLDGTYDAVSYRAGTRANGTTRGDAMSNLSQALIKRIS